MKIFKPKNPVKTLLAITKEGKHARDPRDRLLLWQIRYEEAIGQRPAGATGFNQ